MSEPGVDQAAAVSRLHRAVLGVVFLLVLAFSYSSDLVSWLLDITGGGRSAQVIGLVGVDAAILFAVGLCKRTIGRAEDGGSRLWRPWWTSFGVVAALNATIGTLPQHHPLWVDLVAAVAFAVTMGVLTAVSLNADPRTLFSGPLRTALPADWVRVRAVVPLIVGTFTCYLAGAVFNDFFDADTVRVLDPQTAAEVAAMPLADRLSTLGSLCENAVSPAFYDQAALVMPLLLLTLGVEFNYFRRTLLDPVQRAVTAATVTVLSAGLAFALSILPFDGVGGGDVPSYWHEYLTFVVAVQAITIGLATLIWLLVTGTSDSGAESGG